MNNEDESFPDMSEEFVNNLRLYNEMKAEGKNLYLDSTDYIDIIHYYMDETMHEEALQAIESALRIHPDEESLLLLKAENYCELYKTDKASEVLDQIENKSSVKFRLINADILGMDNQTDEALCVLNSITEEEILEEDRSLLLELLESYADVECNEKITEWLSVSSKWESLSDEFLEMLTGYYGLTQDFESAHKIYNILLDHDPYSAHYWCNQANVLFLLQRYQEAIDACDFALVIDKDVDIYYVKITSYMKLNNFEKVMEEAEKAYQQERISYQDYLMYMGNAKFMLKELEQALSFFTKALKEMNHNFGYYPDLLSKSAQCFIRLFKFEEAQKICNKMFREFSDHYNANLINGMLCLNCGDKEKASKFWAKALKISPNVSTYNDIGILCMDIDKPEIAKTYLHEGEKIDPFDKDLIRSIAIMYLKLDDAEKCMQYINIFNSDKELSDEQKESPLMQLLNFLNHKK